MVEKIKKYNISINQWLPFCILILLYGILGIAFNFYYDLNDDALIKDIVSGAYTGTPDAHTIQMLYPVSWIISMFYRLIPGLPWFGIFLSLCQGVSFYLIMQRSMQLISGKIKKALVVFVEVLVIAAICVWELVIVQYTITAALLAAAACFLVFTEEMPEKVDCKIFIRKNITAIVLVILAFNVRSEMLMLMSPFIAATGILKWSMEKRVFEKGTVRKYLSLVGVILGGLIVSLLIDFAAYGGKEWRTFRDFFDARTQVYDYTWYPAYEDAENFYHDIGMNEVQVALIDNYNFGLDDSIDADKLWKIADYAEDTNTKAPFSQRMKTALGEYKWRTFHDQDAPYNYVVLAAYVTVIFLALITKDKSIVWKLPLVIFMRSIPWMYVILANRVPARISHPLYFIEFIVLSAWIFSYLPKQKYYFGAVWAAILFVLAIGILPDSIGNLSAEIDRRASVNETMAAFHAFARENPENYYYLDVYSTVAYSETMFANVDNSQKNYDVLGGWASGSPLQKKATDAWSADRLSRAELLLLDNFYFVIEEGRDISFLSDFYRTMGVEIEIDSADTIVGQERGFVIYNIYGKNTIY